MCLVLSVRGERVLVIDVPCIGSESLPPDGDVATVEVRGLVLQTSESISTQMHLEYW